MDMQQQHRQTTPSLLVLATLTTTTTTTTTSQLQFNYPEVASISRRFKLVIGYGNSEKAYLAKPNM